MSAFIIGLLIVLIAINVYQMTRSGKAKGTLYMTRRTNEEETMQVGIDISPDLSSEEILEISMRLGTGLEKRLEFHNDRKIRRTEEAHRDYMAKQQAIKDGKVSEINKGQNDDN